MEEKKHRGLAIGALQEKIGEKAESAASSGKELAGHAVEALQEKIGDKAENAIGNVMENTRFEAPELLIRPGQGVSQQLPEMEGRLPIPLFLEPLIHRRRGDGPPGGIQIAGRWPSAFHHRFPIDAGRFFEGCPLF